MSLRRVGWIAMVAAGMATPLSWGCGPSGDRDDLGTVLEEVPEVSGAEEPFEMPELGPAPPEEEEFGALQPPR